MTDEALLFAIRFDFALTPSEENDEGDEDEDDEDEDDEDDEDEDEEDEDEDTETWQVGRLRLTSSIGLPRLAQSSQPSQGWTDSAGVARSGGSIVRTQVPVTG